MTTSRSPTRPLVVMVPDWSGGNPYQSLLQRSVKAQGFDVVFFSDFPKRPLALTRVRLAHPSASVFHLHWINELVEPILWTKYPLLRWVKRAILALDITLVRLLGARVVWTVHNLIAHESPDTEAERRARVVIARFANELIVHSESALRAITVAYGLGDRASAKVSVVRHGHYDGYYPAAPARAQEMAQHWGLCDDCTSVLFFGAIRPYKGVVNLIDAFRRSKRTDLRLIIAGRPLTADLGAKIAAAARPDPRILLSLDFIPDKDVAAYFALADVVVIPFEKTLSSSSAVLAMTMGKALILPRQAAVLDLARNGGALFYDADHSLTDCLNSLDKVRLRQMGVANRVEVLAFDWSATGSRTAEVYCGIREQRFGPRWTYRSPKETGQE